jgi:hypothetical protein
LIFIHVSFTLFLGSESMDNAADESWQLLLSMLPMGWEQQAVLCGAVERLRGFQSVGELLRVLLMHVGKGYSLRETAVRARRSGLAEVSDVALLLRLRKVQRWWRQLCLGLLQESGWSLGADPRHWNLRAVDGTLVQEPGRTGAQWRIHYSLRLPSLECDSFEITAAQGAGTGEKLERLAVAPGDLILADRGFCRPAGVAGVAQQDGALIVRLHSSSLPLYRADGQRFAVLEQLRQVTQVGQAREWSVQVRSADGTIEGRVCALRKSEQDAARAERRVRRKAQQSGKTTRPATLEFACYVVVFTTVPASDFSAAEVLELYRSRWQIELAFKRLKSLAQLGHLPKHDAEAARAWLYGKLLLALLSQKLARHGRDFSPWGYPLAGFAPEQRMAAV